MIYGGNYLSDMPVKVVDPFVQRTEFDWQGRKLSYGCGFGSYDVRLDQDIYITRAMGMVLGSTVEKFTMPENMLAIVHDKSSLVRLGLAVHNTLIDPGWCGYLTLELRYHGADGALSLKKGMPIAQVVFHQVICGRTYEGKYQNQERGPQESR